MQAIYLIHREALKKAVVNHGLSALTRFLSRLENKMYSTAGIAALCKQTRGPKMVAMCPSWPQARIRFGVWEA